MQGQNVDYHGAPWVQNVSRSFEFSCGLKGRHVSVWASHGRYFDSAKGQWQWQRPFLFCTTEDLLTQSIVYPYLIPMLERAGAVVVTPRERDYQTAEAIVDNDVASSNLFPGQSGGEYSEKGGWKTAGKGFGMTYVSLNDTIQPFLSGTSRMAAAGSGATAMWTPHVPARGRYAVYVSYPSLAASVDDAHYTVYHAGGVTDFRVNQQMGGGTWVYLGTFLFEEGAPERNRVVLSADSRWGGGSSEGIRYVVGADAVRFGGGMGIVERSVPDVSYTYFDRVVKVPVPLDSVSSVTCDVAKETGMDVEKFPPLPDSAYVPNVVLRDSVVTDSIAHYYYNKGVRSGLPRYLEAARYYTQWAGIPDSLCNTEHGFGDYKDDLRTRSHFINNLGGGSCYQPDTIGRKVPLELQFALHTDAGFHRNCNVYGSLSIATLYDDFGHEQYRTGESRELARDYAGRMLDNVADDLSQIYNVHWPKRELRVANYSETRAPQIPAIILELLSHQNYRDMTFAHDPNFRFNAARSIYKVLLREIYRRHSLGEPIVQPLPVTDMRILHSEDGIEVAWNSVVDSLEPSAVPNDYMVYIRQNESDWDNGTRCNGQNHVRLNLKEGVHYQVRVTALNDGGESFPSEPLSVYLSKSDSDNRHFASQSKPSQILLVNAFDRLSGPARVEKADSLGFDLHRDVGVSYGVNTSIAGCQRVFARSAVGKSGESSLGYCTDEYVGVPLAGNCFDGIALHADDMIKSLEAFSTMPEVRSQSSQQVQYVITSMSRSAFDGLTAEQLAAYDVIDYIAGLQSDRSYNLKRYEVMSSATKSQVSTYLSRGGRFFISGSSIGEVDSTYLATTFHAVKRAVIQHDMVDTSQNTIKSASDVKVFSGLGIDIPVFTSPNAAHYPCQESDVIEASDENAFTAFTYSKMQDENAFIPAAALPSTGCAPSPAYSAGIATSQCVLMAFPYDCISNCDVRRKVMAAILQHLLSR